MTETPAPQTLVLDGNLRSHNIRLPEAARRASGIRILGRKIRTAIFTTDIALIRNCDADAVFAVYPFTPQQIISKMLVEASSIPVLVGVGGGTTSGARSAQLAYDAEAAGAYGVVLNAPASYTTLEMVSRIIDIPTIATVVSPDLEIVRNKIQAGASIINVAGGTSTASIVAAIRETFPDVPIMATGGKSEESIIATVEAGANTIICTPPSTAELFSPMMETYRTSAVVGGKSHDIRPISEASLAEIQGRLEGIRSLRLLTED